VGELTVCFVWFVTKQSHRLLRRLRFRAQEAGPVLSTPMLVGVVPLLAAWRPTDQALRGWLEQGDPRLVEAWALRSLAMAGIKINVCRIDRSGDTHDGF